jgi:hypothetical protein
MQARLTINRFPSILVAIVFGLAAALILGGALGYVLKPAATISGAIKVLVVSNPGANEPCVFVDKQKAC